MTPKRVLKANMAQTQGFHVSGWAAMTLSCNRIPILLISVCKALAPVNFPMNFHMQHDHIKSVAPTLDEPLSALMICDSGGIVWPGHRRSRSQSQEATSEGWWSVATKRLVNPSACNDATVVIMQQVSNLHSSVSACRPSTGCSRS